MSTKEDATNQHGVAGGEAGLREALEGAIGVMHLHSRRENFHAGFLGEPMDTARPMDAYEAGKMARAALASTSGQPSHGASGERDALVSLGLEWLRAETSACDPVKLRNAADAIEAALAASVPPVETAGLDEVDTIASALWSSDYPGKDDVNWNDWVFYVSESRISSTLIRTVEDYRRRAHAVLAALRPRQDTRAGGAVELYEKLEGDSLDAITEVIGSPALYNKGKSAMRDWFLGRLRRAWKLPDPAPTGTLSDDGEGSK